jgi:hypothetical protein
MREIEFPNPARSFEPVHPGHADIHEHEVRHKTFRTLDRFCSAMNLLHVVAEQLKQCGDQCSRVFVVIDDENAASNDRTRLIAQGEFEVSCGQWQRYCERTHLIRPALRAETRPPCISTSVLTKESPNAQSAVAAVASSAHGTKLAAHSRCTRPRRFKVTAAPVGNAGPLSSGPYCSVTLQYADAGKFLVTNRSL